MEIPRQKRERATAESRALSAAEWEALEADFKRKILATYTTENSGINNAAKLEKTAGELAAKFGFYYRNGHEVSEFKPLGAVTSKSPWLRLRGVIMRDIEGAFDKCDTEVRDGARVLSRDFNAIVQARLGVVRGAERG